MRLLTTTIALAAGLALGCSSGPYCVPEDDRAMCPNGAFATCDYSGDPRGPRIAGCEDGVPRCAIPPEVDATEPAEPACL